MKQACKRSTKCKALGDPKWDGECKTQRWIKKKMNAHANAENMEVVEETIATDGEE